MKQIIATLLVTVCWMSPAIAQEQQGNFWVNPRSGMTEKLDLNQILPQVGRTPINNDDWIEIAQLGGGDRLLVKPASVRQRHMPGRNEETVFRARFQSRPSLTGRNNRDDGTYAASCSDRGLTRLSDGQLENGFDVPVLPGTAGEALFNWACQG